MLTASRMLIGWLYVFLVTRKPVESISFAVGSSKTVYGIILYVPNEVKMLTAVSVFKLSEEVLTGKIYEI